jgi:dynein heavy chain
LNVTYKFPLSYAGVYGPPLGKRCLMFVDDINLPESECGSQPPVELLRQLLDHESWFELVSGTPLKLMDLQLVCAMGPSPRGLQGTSQRFLRHFSSLSINEIEETILTSIFSRLMLWHLDTRLKIYNCLVIYFYVKAYIYIFLDFQRI